MNMNMSCDWENNQEIQLFREYLRIPTVHPNVDYGDIFFVPILQKLIAAKLLIFFTAKTSLFFVNFWSNKCFIVNLE